MHLVRDAGTTLCIQHAQEHSYEGHETEQAAIVCPALQLPLPFVVHDSQDESAEILQAATSHAASSKLCRLYALHWGIIVEQHATIDHFTRASVLPTRQPGQDEQSCVGGVCAPPRVKLRLDLCINMKCSCFRAQDSILHNSIAVHCAGYQFSCTQ